MSKWWAAAGLAAAVVFASGANGCGADPPGGGGGPVSGPQQGELSFRLLEDGIYSGIQTERQVVVTDHDAWERFYQEHNPDEAPPEVDFGRQMVVGVILTRETGGHTLRLERVAEGPGQLDVIYSEERPSGDAVVIQVLTQPYFLAAIPRREGKPLVFQPRVRLVPPGGGG